MTTLIAVYNSDGCVGRCDAKCYEAVAGECHCVCGGANHGAGLSRARDNVRGLLRRQLEVMERHGFELRFEEDQLALFD